MKIRNVLILLLLLSGTYCKLYSQDVPFIPTEFKVPQVLENENFRIRMLTVNDVVKDYDAVMSSVEHLKGVFGPKSKLQWSVREPAAGAIYTGRRRFSVPIYGQSSG